MNYKIYVLTLFVLLMGCNKQKSIEDILIAEPNEYWVSYSPISGDFTYFKFGKDKKSRRYERDRKTNRFYKVGGEGDIAEEVPQKWSVSKDSILKFDGFVYDIASYNEEVIVLYYTYKEADRRKERMVFF